MTETKKRTTSVIALLLTAVMIFSCIFTFAAEDVSAYSNTKAAKKRAKKVYKWLVEEKNFTKFGAICAVANFDVEASINPKAGSTYYGIAQWGGSRKRKLKKKKKHWTLDVQMKYFYKEMKTSYKGSFKKLKNAKNLKQGTKALMRYEGCSSSTYGRRIKRGKYWKKYLKEVKLDTDKDKSKDGDESAEKPAEGKKVKYPTLKAGSKGKHVKKVQNKLKIKADGLFGKKTAKAVKKFQKKNGLKADGIVGKKTWNALGYK